MFSLLSPAELYNKDAKLQVWGIKYIGCYRSEDSLRFLVPQAFIQLSHILSYMTFLLQVNHKFSSEVRAEDNHMLYFFPSLRNFTILND